MKLYDCDAINFCPLYAMSVRARIYFLHHTQTRVVSFELRNTKYVCV